MTSGRTPGPVLGCVLAGGQSRRFGSDKALAEIDGQSLIVRAVDILSGWCDHVVVVGREEAPAPTLPDWPRPGMGPLGGLAAALHFACDEAYAAVLSCGVDCAGLPDDLPQWLLPAQSPPYGAVYVETQPVIGLWPVAVSPMLDALLESTASHSLRALAERTKARPVRLPYEAANINTPEDLAAFLAARAGRTHHYGEQSHGL